MENKIYTVTKQEWNERKKVGFGDGSLMIKINGKKINVVIKSIENENNKILLSYKELLGNWEENIQEYQEKMIVKGIVKEPDKYKNGIFIELKPNLVGLAEYKEGLKYGQKVNVYIKKIIKERKKIKLVII